MTEAFEAPPPTLGLCSKEECPSNRGGACVEGYEDRIDCEYYELIQEEAPGRDETTSTRLDVPDGEALSPDLLETVLRAMPTTRVVPLGLPGAGKTTLIAMIYNLVRARRLLPWTFAGSQTVIGFARRSFDASTTSGRDLAVTPRTEVGESGYWLDLQLRNSSDDERRSILLADVAGEHIRRFTDGENVQIVTDSVLAADHLPIVLNGSQLADPTKRSLAVMRARNLLKRLEQLPVTRKTDTFLVVSRLDQIGATDLTETIDAVTRGTIAEGNGYLSTADRNSVVSNASEDPAVKLGAGAGAFVDRIAPIRRGTEPVLNIAAPVYAPHTLWLSWIRR